MICPYNRKTLKQIVQTKQDINEFGNIEFKEDIIIEEYVLMECFESRCAVWNSRQAKCSYNG